MKKKVIIILIVIIIGFAGYKYFSREKEVLYDFVLAQRGDVIQEVSVTGTVAPAKKIDLQFQAQGEIKEIKVKVGDKVKNGDELVKLDNAELNSQLLERQASLELAQAKIDQLLAGASVEDIKLAETAVLNAQENLDKIKQSTNKDITGAELSLNSAQVSLDNAGQNLIDIKADAEQDLENDYQSALNKIYDGYLHADKAMTCLDDVFEDYPNDYALEGCFNCSDFQKKIDAESQKSKANNALAKITVTNNNLSTNSSRIKIGASLIEFKEQLEIIKLALNLTSDVLDKSSINSSLCPSKSLATLKTNIDTSRTNLNTAITDIRSAGQEIDSTKITNQTNINAAQATVNSKQAALDSAQQSLSAAQSTAEKQIVAAEGQLKTAQDQLALKKAPVRQTDIALYQAQAKQAQANLSYIREQIRKNILISPTEGIITNIEGEIGEITKAGQSVVSIMSFSGFQIEADISESDIAKISLNNPVEITLDAFGDEEEWTGEVLSIDPAEKLISGVVYYKITVIFSQLDPKINSGMTANLIITTATRKNVLVVPQRAVIEKNSHKVVRVLVGEEMKEQTVQTGLRGSQGEIEIISGIKEGDKVVTFVKEK